MSGPVLQGGPLGALNSFAINEGLAINQSNSVFRIDFALVNEEFIGSAFILGKINGVNVVCPGQNANDIRAPQRAGAVPPDCRRIERLP